MAKKFLVPVILAAGAVGAPSLHFGDATTGFYKYGTNQIGVSAAGSVVMQIAPTSMLFYTDTMQFYATGTDAPAILANHSGSANGEFSTIRSRAGTTNVGLGDVLGRFRFKGWEGDAHRNSAWIEGVVDATPSTGVVPAALVLYTGNTERLRIGSDGLVTIAGALKAAAGAVGTPSIYLSTDSTTGLYRVGANSLGIAVSGANALTIDANGIAVAKSVTVGTGGTYAAGSIYSDANWGMIFRAKQASPALAEFLWTNSAGTEMMRLAPTLMTLGLKGSAPALRLEAADGVNEGGELRFGGAASFGDVTIDNNQGILRVINATGAVAHISATGKAAFGTSLSPLSYIQLYVHQPATTAATVEYGVWTGVSAGAARGVYGVIGIQGVAQTVTGFSGTGQQTGVFGLYNNVDAGLTITSGIGIQGVAGSAATGTITNLIGVVGGVSNSGGATVSNGWSFYTGDHSVGTLAVGYYSGMASGTGKWAFYGAGTAASYLGGTLTIAGAGATADNAGQIFFNGTTSNRIDWNTNGVAAPAFTTRSAGTKLVLYPNVSGAAVDYAIGIESGCMWASVATTGQTFKWYGGTTVAMTLTGGGALTVTGAVAATSFAGASSGLTGRKVNDFRLTLTSAVPVTTSDVTAATTIYCCPYKGNQISLYDGSVWVTRTSAQFSLALGTLTSGKPYDVFCYDNAGTPTLEFLVWTDDTTRATALAYQDGVLVKSGAATRRYLGTFYTTSTTTTEDSRANRYLWNYYHRCKRGMSVFDSTDSWTYTSSTLREARGVTTNRLNFVLGVGEDAISVYVINIASNTTAGQNIYSGIGIDSTTAFATGSISGYGATYIAANAIQVTAYFDGVVAAGKHYASRLEACSVTGAVTWYGDGGAVGLIQSGITGSVMS